MSYALAFDYDHEIGTLRRILQVSQRTQWNVDQFDWGKSAPDTAFGRVLDWQGVLRSDYVRGLPGAKKDELARQLVAYDFSQILHGEQCALMLAGQLINAVDDLDAKLCAATQARDEARHVDAVKKLIGRIGPIYPPARLLLQVVDELLNTKIWPRQVLGLQLFLEARALLTFRNYLTFVEDPVFTAVIRNVERDESQHVAFGMQYLKTGVDALSPADRESVIEFGCWLDNHIWNLQGTEDYRRVFEGAGLDFEAFQATYLRSVFLAPSRQLTVQTARALDDIHNQFHRWFYGALSRVGLDEVIDRRKGKQMSVEERREAGEEAKDGLPWVGRPVLDAEVAPPATPPPGKSPRPSRGRAAAPGRPARKARARTEA